VRSIKIGFESLNPVPSSFGAHSNTNAEGSGFQIMLDRLLSQSPETSGISGHARKENSSVKELLSALSALESEPAELDGPTATDADLLLQLALMLALNGSSELGVISRESASDPQALSSTVEAVEPGATPLGIPTADEVANMVQPIHDLEDEKTEAIGFSEKEASFDAEKAVKPEDGMASQPPSKMAAHPENSLETTQNGLQPAAAGAGEPAGGAMQPGYSLNQPIIQAPVQHQTAESKLPVIVDSAPNQEAAYLEQPPPGRVTADDNATRSSIDIDTGVITDQRLALEGPQLKAQAVSAPEQKPEASAAAGEAVLESSEEAAEPSQYDTDVAVDENTERSDTAGSVVPEEIPIDFDNQLTIQAAADEPRNDKARDHVSTDDDSPISPEEEWEAIESVNREARAAQAESDTVDAGSGREHNLVRYHSVSKVETTTDASDLNTNMTLAGKEAGHVSEPSQSASGTSFAHQMRETIMVQIVEHMRVQLGGEEQQVHIQLKPEYLGDVRITLTVKHGQVSAEITAQNPLTSEIIQAAIPELRFNLQQLGVDLGDVNVGSSFQDNQQGFTGERRHSFNRQSRFEAKLDQFHLGVDHDSLLQVNLRV